MGKALNTVTMEFREGISSPKFQEGHESNEQAVPADWKCWVPPYPAGLSGAWHLLMDIYDCVVII